MLPMKGVKISDICLLNPPSSWGSDSKFQVKLKYGNETKLSTRSAAKKGDVDSDCVVWNESFTFAGDIMDNSQIMFAVIRAHRLIPKTIGSSKRRVVDLIKMQSDSGSCRVDITGKCHLTLNVEELSDVFPEAVGEASVQFHNDQEQTWSSFLLQFQVFMNVMDGVSEISPYVKIAWSILSVIPKTIITQRNRDDKVKHLYGKLKSTYDYVTDAKRLPELTTAQSKTLVVLVKQTIECAYFIRAYNAESTVKNVVKGASMDDRIQGFNDKLDHLMKVMTDSISLETSIVTLRVSEKINELNDLTLLEGMPYDSDAGFIPGKRCFPGTRQTLIKEILEWVNNDASPQILVLSGQAGTGKSAVAHTIAGLFRGQNRLGSMFCFNRSYKDRCNFLFSTISRDLADGDGMWQKELVKVIKKAADRKSKDAQIQFEELIVKPSQNVSTIGSVIIVVDALDESGDRGERKEIMRLLFDKCSELPKNYRIIITSRPEQDIELQCQNSSVRCIRMGDINVKETHSDIQTYISGFLAPISSNLDRIDRDWCRILAKRAEGLFQWARTACEFIDPTITRSQLIEKKWKTCISDSSSSLYGLYHQIIYGQSESKDVDFIEDFRTIVGAIITAREPLSINALQYIFPSIGDIKTILSPFGSLFVGGHDSFTPVRPLHTSLFDFFTATKNKYCIDISDQSVMAVACLKLMNQMLCFNICKLETSHLRNRDVPNIDTRVKEAIPSHLSYSCRFWAFHLQQSNSEEDLLCEIRRLMDCNLLFLFEALSLLGEVDQGRVAMQKLANWCTDVDEGLAADALDAWNFGYEFGDMMTRSTPHLYLSALPFTPQDSFISKRYLPLYPGLFTFDIGQPVHSSRNSGLQVVRRHTYSFPVSVAFSRKGKYIATGSNDGEFLIWDYVTGELVYQYGPNSSSPIIVDIVFSLCGEFIYCCFDNGDILVWNNRTNEMHMESYGEGILLGHDDYCSFCTISSDGHFIALGARRGLIYDRANLREFDEHWPFNFCAFSPNGDFLAFEKDSHMCIWNTRKQTLHELAKCVYNTDLALSGSYVAFLGNSLSSLEIWDVQTSMKVTAIEHDAYTSHFRFSPDNQYILSSSDNTYSIWSVLTAELISRSSVDDTIRCLAFSHDSKSIALGTKDGAVSVRQWDTSIQPRSHAMESDVRKIWLRGTYLILCYYDVFYFLQISDITTTNTIVLGAEVMKPGLVTVCGPEEKHVHVAYITSRGLCFWDDKEGEVLVDGLGCTITMLQSSGKYLISCDEEGSVKIWDVDTRHSVGGPHKVRRSLDLLQVCIAATGTNFIVADNHQVEIRDCGSGCNVGGPFMSEQLLREVAFSANERHIICMTSRNVEILDVLTGKRANRVPDIDYYFGTTLSMNGRYLAWMKENCGVGLLDTDTETPLNGPSLNSDLSRVWFSSDSKQLITLSYAHDSSTMAYLDIWDTQSEAITKSIWIPQVKDSQIGELVLSDRYLALFRHSSHTAVWDLGVYEKMLSLYETHRNDSQLPTKCSEVEWSMIRDNASLSKSAYKKEMLDYALTAWKKASLAAFAKMDHGWVLGLRGELLFWVPKKRRQGFWYPCIMHVPLQNVTKLNFNNFIHGTRWTECKGNTST